MARDNTKLAREKAAYLYHVGINEGRPELIERALKQAETDPELKRILEELDEARNEEGETN